MRSTAALLDNAVNAFWWQRWGGIGVSGAATASEFLANQQQQLFLSHRMGGFDISSWLRLLPSVV